MKAKPTDQDAELLRHATHNLKLITTYSKHIVNTMEDNDDLAGLYGLAYLFLTVNWRASIRLLQTDRFASTTPRRAMLLEHMTAAADAADRIRPVMARILGPLSIALRSFYLPNTPKE